MLSETNSSLKRTISFLTRVVLVAKIFRGILHPYIPTQHLRFDCLKYGVSNSERRSPLRKKKSSQFGGGNSGVRTEKLKSGYRELFSREKLGKIADFMSASSLAGIGAPVKLWVDTSALLICFTLCCIIQQSFYICFLTVSMRLRPKRTCSGVECFGCFHIQRRAFSLFLYLRRPVYTIKNQIFC
ncbi:unnamed protein product [Lactuca virosa]|uniref:Reticulon-like protein n=1 Tax=Lactuca virosa TaxID=75947 RepID=A0AAU9M7R5_9ASTR|nr:unnamed protein product [Lactuca virosa]